MADMLAKGTEWLNAQRRAHLSQTVTYERHSGGGNASVELPAAVGQTVFRLDDGYGAAIRHVSRDFLIAAEDLVLEGAPVTPQRGDRIRKTVGGITYIHEVMGPGASGGEPDWKYSDSQRTTFRVHTKQIDQETAP